MQVWPINIWPRLFYLLQLIYGYMLLALESVHEGSKGERSALTLEEGNTLILFGRATQGN
jgi:hypothetical protein